MTFNCPQCKLEISNNIYFHVNCNLKFVYNENNGVLIVNFNGLTRKYLNIKRSEIEDKVNNWYQNALFE